MLASNDIIFGSNDIASNALLKDRKIENVDYGRKGDERTKSSSAATAKRFDIDRRWRLARINKNLAAQSKTTGPKRPHDACTSGGC
jgi:hypothetical protein